MRRTLERDHFPVAGVSRGEVLVASTFSHPVRGPVTCPAAPVVGAAMLTTGLRVRHIPMPPVGSGDAILHVVSYVDPGGQAVGLGVAAHRDDDPIVRHAEQVVRSWAEVMRTRRVLIEDTGPSCAGLRRETAMLTRITGPAYMLAAGRQHAGPFRWPRNDVHLVQRLADVPDGATVVVPAHGMDPRARAECAARGLRVLDATCPLVARTHTTTQRFVNEGATVVVIGDTGHAAIPSIVGQAPENVVVVSTPDEVDDLVVDTPRRVAFVMSPGLAVEDAAKIAVRLRSRFAGTFGQHPDEFCYSASDRRAGVRAVASCSEKILVLGDPTADDTRVLATTAAATGGAVERLDDIARLRPEWLGPATAVGIVVGTTARPDLPGELIEVLTGLGPLSVTRRQVTTEITHPARTRVSTRRAG